MSEVKDPELDAKLTRIKEVLQGIALYPELLKDLEGKAIPYNIIKKINRVFDLYPISLVMAAKYAAEELGKMGH